LFAQKVSLSPAAIDEGTFENIKVIGQDEDGIFLLMSNLPFEIDRDRVGFKSRKYRIAYYSNELVPKWAKGAETFSKDATVEGVVFFQENLLIVSKIENKSKNEIYISCQQINNKGELVKSKDIGSITLQRFNYDKAEVIFSADQQLCSFIINEYVDDNRQTVHLLIADSSFDNRQKKDLTFNYGEKKFTTTGYSLSNKGDFHVLGVRSIKDKNAERKRQEDFILFSCPAAAQQFTEFVIKENDKDVTNASINFDNINNKIVCAGFYADRNTTLGAGIILASVEMNNPGQLIFKAHPIDTGTQIKLLGERNRNDEIGLISYPIEKIILRNDGGAVIVAEASYTTDYSYYDYFIQSYSYRTEYHYNNIVAISVNNDGQIHWLNIIRKEQESLDDGGAFSSFCTLLTSDEMVFIYNNSISKNSEVVGSRVSNTGEQKEDKIVRSNDHMLLLARDGKQISENEVVIPCVTKKKLLLAKFTF
jgi:hypothetical protein